MFFLIEKLTVHNLGDVAEVGRNFTKSVNYPGGFDMPAFRRSWGPMLQADMGTIFAVRGEGKRIEGLLGAGFIHDPFNGWLTAAEQFWFVHPECRNSSRVALRLLDAFEEEAAVRDCKRILMVHLEGEYAEQLRRLYERRGYRPFERTYTKEL